MRKRAWVSWMLIIAIMITLWPAAVGYALERPVVYPEMNDGRESEYIGETERVRVYDNGEKKKVKVMTVPVDEVQALVWRPVSGASYYLYSIRDVDNDEPVIVNEQMTNYWINLADMLDWDGPLAYGVTYKIAAAACTSPDDCYWSSEPFYFRLVETVQPEEPVTPEPEPVQFSGAFDQERIELTVGDITRVSGSVNCAGDTLNRVTYQIDGWAGDDGNNRYCSQDVQNVTSVDLSQMSQLVLDTTRAPLNVPGTYTLRLVASVESGEWAHLAEMTVVVNPADEPTHSVTEVPEPQAELSGAFASDYIELNIGDVTTVGGSVSCAGSTLNRVTYQIDGWAGDDGNNRYCSQDVQNVTSVDLSQMSQLVLDTTRAPLNVPGTYTLRLAASVESGEWAHLAEMTVVVNPADEPTHSVTEVPVTPAPATEAPAPQAELKADIMNSSIAVKLGDTARIEGWVTCEGGQLERVTYLITGHPVEGDPNNRQYSAALGNVSELDLAEADELILDTNRTPLNAPGDYQIEVYAKAVGMEQGARLANVQVHVYTGEETETHPTPGNSPQPTIDESRKPGDGNDNTLPPATNDVTTPAPTVDLSGVKLQGQFDDDSVELNLGESMRVSGTVACSGDTIVRVTYHFKDHEVSGDPNNRYCTAVLSGQDYVALESLGDLLLDTARDPLNKGGSYTLELWAATARGKAECVDTMTVVVNVICPVYGGAHKMDYTGFEAAHPHKVFRRCACGKAEYTGAYQKMNPCCECGNHYKDGISESAGQYSAHCNKCGMNIALTSTSLLSKGDRGEAVRALQNQLIALGYSVSGGADAIFGSGTEKALAQYQEDMLKKNPALTVSKGVLDAETWKALYNYEVRPDDESSTAVPQECVHEVGFESEHPYHKAYCLKCGKYLTNDERNVTANKSIVTQELSTCDKCFSRDGNHQERALAMAKLVQEAYDMSGVGSRANRLEIRDGWESQTEALIKTSWTNDGELVLSIAFEGSIEFVDDWARDFVATPTWEGIHLGFDTGIKRFMDRYIDNAGHIEVSAQYGDTIWEGERSLKYIIEWIRTHSNSRLRITGHSMGGAYAQCLTYYMISKYGISSEQIETYTFASPIPFTVPFVNRHSELNNAHIYNYVINQDVVTRVGVGDLNLIEPIYKKIKDIVSYTYTYGRMGGYSEVGSHVGKIAYLYSDTSYDVLNIVANIAKNHALSTYIQLIRKRPVDTLSVKGIIASYDSKMKSIADNFEKMKGAIDQEYDLVVKYADGRCYGLLGTLKGYSYISLLQGWDDLEKKYITQYGVERIGLCLRDTISENAGDVVIPMAGSMAYPVEKIAYDRAFLAEEFHVAYQNWKNVFGS